MPSAQPISFSPMRRLAALGAMTAFLGAAVILLWSDRAGSMFGQVIDIVTNTGRRVEQRYEVDLVDRSDIPGQADQIGHAIFWGTGMLLTGWFLRRRVPVSFSALLVGAVSLGFEFAQPALSTTRRIEPSDGVANLVGVLIASIVLGAFLFVWRWWRGDDRVSHRRTEIAPGPYVDEPTDEYFNSL